MINIRLVRLFHSWPLDSQIVKEAFFSPHPFLINYELLVINASEVINISINDANNLTTSTSVKLQLPV